MNDARNEVLRAARVYFKIGNSLLVDSKKAQE